MRNKFGEWINKITFKRDDLYLLSGDIGYGIFDEFKKTIKLDL